MNHAKSIALSMDTERLAQGVQANNLANALTPGFKRVCFSKVLEDVRLGGDIRVETRRDFSQGAIRLTGSPFHISLRGPGFLVFETPVGLRFGRGGMLTQKPDGRLCDGSGNALIGESGPIRIPEGKAFTVDADGVVKDSDGVLGRLRLVGFVEPYALRSVGGGLYESGPGAKPFPDSETEVNQGSLEVSNVDPASEMMEMIFSLRRFEAGANFIRTVERTYDLLLNKT